MPMYGPGMDGDFVMDHIGQVLRDSPRRTWRLVTDTNLQKMEMRKKALLEAAKEVDMNENAAGDEYAAGGEDLSHLYFKISQRKKYLALSLKEYIV